MKWDWAKQSWRSLYLIISIKYASWEGHSWFWLLWQLLNTGRGLPTIGHTWTLSFTMTLIVPREENKSETGSGTSLMWHTKALSHKNPSCTSSTSWLLHLKCSCQIWIQLFNKFRLHISWLMKLIVWRINRQKLWSYWKTTHASVSCCSLVLQSRITPRNSGPSSITSSLKNSTTWTHS